MLREWEGRDKMAKEVLFKGKGEEELKKINLEDFMKVITSRARRSLKRGFSDEQKKLLLKIKKVNEGKFKKIIKTHCRDIVILPEMIGHTIHVYSGKEFIQVMITSEMLGSFLGEYSMTRKKVQHSAPGIGATKSSGAMSVK